MLYILIFINFEYFILDREFFKRRPHVYQYFKDTFSSRGAAPRDGKLFTQIPLPGSPEGPVDLFVRDLVADLGVELGEERPVQAGAAVMRGVEPEVPGQAIVEPVLPVAARHRVAVDVTSRVVLVGGPHRVEQRDEGGNEEQERGLERLEREAEPEQRPERDLHPQVGPQVLGVPAACAEDVLLVMQEQVERVLDPAHRRPVRSRPARFVRLRVGPLVQVVDVVADVVVPVSVSVT